MGDCAHPEVPVGTDRNAAHAGLRRIRIVEVDTNTALYGEGHVPRAVGWTWDSQLYDTVRRDIGSREAFEWLTVGKRHQPGSADTAVLLHGDNNNRFAAWGFRRMKLYGTGTCG